MGFIPPMRSLFAVALLLSACSSLPEPTAPPEGAYGYVRQDGETAISGIEGLTIVALATANTAGVMVTDDMPTTVTDANGNFSLPLTPNSYELCFVDGGYAVDCDCTIDMQNDGQQFYRYYLREQSAATPGGWQGEWYGHNPQSSCVEIMGD